MPIYFYNGSILIKPQGIAMDKSCCCGPPSGTCEGIPSKLFLTVDGGDDCSGMTGYTLELNFDSTTGSWLSDNLNPFCGVSGNIYAVLQCLTVGVPLNSSLKDRLLLGVDILCNVMPIGGPAPCITASKNPFYAEFFPYDLGPDWAECSSCCTGRETEIKFIVTE